jgi:Rrf2 family protein
MDLSKTTQYALRLMSFMASRNELQYTTEELHEQLGIPKQYLRRLMTGLSKKGLLRSGAGRKGGFSLARKASEIFLSEILDVVEERQVLQSCIFGFEHCFLEKKCPMHDKWAEARISILNILKNTSLAEMNVNLLPYISPIHH